MGFYVILLKINSKGEILKKKKVIRKKSFWFKIYCGFAKLVRKKTKFVYLGQEFTNQSLILSNHVGASGPLSFELYHEKTFRYWGAHEMNGHFHEVYRYLSNIYFTEKKHWKKWIAKIVAFFATPFCYLFYRGLKLIPTYHDGRLRKALDTSYQTLNEGQSVVIFPEKSEHGYFDHLTGFHAGFTLLLKYCYARGMDLPIYLAYYDHKSHIHLVDKPVLYSEIKDKFATKEDMAKYFCDRCNALGDMIAENKIS